MKTLIMLLFCPAYRRNFPARYLPGVWTAEVYTTNMFSSYERIRYREEYVCNFDAYRAARWEALKADWRIDCDEIGVNWRIYRKDDNVVALPR